MKKIILGIIIIIFISLILLLINHYYPFLGYVKEWGRNIGEDIKEFSGAITAIVALLNIVFLISFRSIDSEKRKNDAIHDRKSFWFRDVILSRNFENLNNLNSLLNRLPEISVDNRDETDMLSIIESFQYNKRILGHSLFDALGMIDSRICDLLHNKLDDLEDFFTVQLEEIFTCPADLFSIAEQELRVKFTMYKNEILRDLYTFEMNGYITSNKVNKKKKSKEQGNKKNWRFSKKEISPPL
ncbi:hypothetical protein M3201_11860 [Paenibacillus motobuensis]|uniref:hypothetical protein n=1 Tax=Paenibacillus TaxID=44249 RepID=UPI00203B1AF0|nr:MULTISPECIES: hypothetical protein [Paenibacillus]MCM3040394.1 hypothetical protein [Paenibacillus lutimineralis]MCM3647498.1 hypothetical protein [Paenibacillus motobuensis]